jgi:hypothetical protein
MYEKEINWKEWHIPTKRLNIVNSWWITVRNVSLWSQINRSTIYSLDLQPFCFKCKRVSTAAVAIFASNNRGGGSHLGFLVIYQKVQPANLCKDAASCTLIWRNHHSPAAQYFTWPKGTVCTVYGGRILGNWNKCLKSFPPCYSLSPLPTYFIPPLPRSKSGLKL